MFRFPPQTSNGVLKLVTVKEISLAAAKKEDLDEAGKKRELEWQRAAVKEALSTFFLGENWNGWLTAIYSCCQVC